MSNSQGAWVYKTARWAKLRAMQLLLEPLCRYCKQIGHITPATTVDHIRPHRGDRNKAFDPQNLQSLCESCHNRHAQAKDNGKPVAGCDAEGYPLDPSHPWGSN